MAEPRKLDKVQCDDEKLKSIGIAQVYIMGTQKDFLLPFAHSEGK